MSKFMLCGVAALVAMAGAAQAATYRGGPLAGRRRYDPLQRMDETGDGTWVLNGSIKLGASVIDDVGVKGDAAARALDKRCGK